MRQWYIILFFFFQAEDGIRDVAVTGVQTCALPIFGVGDGLKRLVREDIIGRIRKLSVGSPRPRTTSVDVLEGLDAVKDVPNVLKVHAAMICAKEKGAWLDRRVKIGRAHV